MESWPRVWQSERWRAWSQLGSPSLSTWIQPCLQSPNLPLDPSLGSPGAPLTEAGWTWFSVIYNRDWYLAFPPLLPACLKQHKPQPITQVLLPMAFGCLRLRPGSPSACPYFSWQRPYSFFRTQFTCHHLWALPPTLLPPGPQSKWQPHCLLGWLFFPLSPEILQSEGRALIYLNAFLLNRLCPEPFLDSGLGVQHGWNMVLWRLPSNRGSST